MQTVTTDFIELSQLKQFLQKHKSINLEELEKYSCGQSVLNNKFFHDFDADGYITFSDYNIAWNWLLQGKPTDIFEFAKNKSSCPEAYKLPYQFIQDNDDNILLDNRVPDYEDESEPLSEEAPTVESEDLDDEDESEYVSEDLPTIEDDDPVPVESVSFDTPIHEKTKVEVVQSNVTTQEIKSNPTYNQEPDEGEPTPLVVAWGEPESPSGEQHRMQAVTTDFIELSQLKEFLRKHKSIDLNELEKYRFGQSVLNNKFFHDFDMDGKITFSDYNIAWNWLLQGKPTNIFEFAKNKSASPRAYKLPYQFIQDNDDNILLDNRIPVYDSMDGTVVGETAIPMGGASSSTEFEVTKSSTSEPSSDFNNDGEVDDLDLQILEGYILLQPSTLEEYNANRGDFPLAVTLPNVLTAKFSCDNVYYYGDIDMSGHSIINDADIEYYIDILNGTEPLPGSSTLAFILSNTIPYEVVRTCELNGSIEDSQLCVKLQEGVFAKQNQQSFTSSLYYTLSYDSQKSTEEEKDIWTYSDSNISIEIGGPISNSWYIIVKDESLENVGSGIQAILAEGYSTMIYLSKEDPGATYPWCTAWDWDTGYDDTTIADQHLFNGNTRYETVLGELGIETLQGIRKLVTEVNQGTCSEVYDMSTFDLNQESENYEVQTTGEFRKQTVTASEVRSDFLGPGFRHTLMACNIRDEIVVKELHSTMMYKVDYRDYLIMKEWLRLGNPDTKNLQSENSLIDWFNKNSRDGTPFACALPYQIYDWIGTGFAFANAYSGEENL